MEVPVDGCHSLTVNPHLALAAAVGSGLVWSAGAIPDFSDRQSGVASNEGGELRPDPVSKDGHESAEGGVCKEINDTVPGVFYDVMGLNHSTLESHGLGNS